MNAVAKPTLAVGAQTRTFNEANEVLTRDPDGAGGAASQSPAFDGNGNQTDDGANYTYVYDAFGRLRQVKNRTTPFALVGEYRYNALGFRIGWRYDSVTPAGIDASDPWYYFQHNEKWQIVATFRGSDTSPKERFVWHLAGLDGQGGSSYIDSMIVRELDANGSGGGGWTAASDGTLEKRYYYAQNWRADVSAMVDDTGKLIERVKYSAYGTPFGLPAGDSNSDGAWDATDSSNVSGAPPYTIQCDADLSGTISAADATHANSIRGGFQTLGRGKLSSAAIYSRLGYAGYQYDPTFQASRQLHHVRHRVLDSGFGRWLRRDPIGYHDGMGLYEYVKSKSVTKRDSMGLKSQQCGSTSTDFGNGNGSVYSGQASSTGTCVQCILCEVVVPDYAGASNNSGCHPNTNDPGKYCTDFCKNAPPEEKGLCLAGCTCAAVPLGWCEQCCQGLDKPDVCQKWCRRTNLNGNDPDETECFKQYNIDLAKCDADYQKCQWTIIPSWIDPTISIGGGVISLCIEGAAATCLGIGGVVVGVGAVICDVHNNTKCGQELNKCKNNAWYKYYKCLGEY